MHIGCKRANGNCRCLVGYHIFKAPTSDATNLLLAGWRTCRINHDLAVKRGVVKQFALCSLFTNVLKYYILDETARAAYSLIFCKQTRFKLASIYIII